MKLIIYLVNSVLPKVAFLFSRKLLKLNEQFINLILLVLKYYKRFIFY